VSYRDDAAEQSQDAIRWLEAIAVLALLDVFRRERSWILSAVRGLIADATLPSGRVIGISAIRLRAIMGQALARVQDALVAQAGSDMARGAAFARRLLTRLGAPAQPRNTVLEALRLATLQQQRQGVFARVIGRVTQSAVADFERSVMRGDTATVVATTLESSIDGIEYQISRVGRTETAQAFAVGAMGETELARTVLPGLLNRWTELVDDVTGAPLDNRVGIDSMHLHGQVAQPGGLFFMPAGAPVSPSLQGGAWTHPPNRPHDRAVLLPWTPGCGVPAWSYQTGTKVEVA
jgi:hypothetical protein